MSESKAFIVTAAGELEPIPNGAILSGESGVWQLRDSRWHPIAYPKGVSAMTEYEQKAREGYAYESLNAHYGYYQITEQQRLDWVAAFSTGFGHGWRTANPANRYPTGIETLAYREGYLYAQRIPDEQHQRTLMEIAGAMEARAIAENSCPN